MEVNKAFADTVPTGICAPGSVPGSVALYCTYARARGSPWCCRHVQHRTPTSHTVARVRKEKRLARSLCVCAGSRRSTPTYISSCCLLYLHLSQCIGPCTVAHFSMDSMDRRLHASYTPAVRI